MSETACIALEGCPGAPYVKGLCTAHYEQQRTGRPFRKYPWTAEDRFWARVCDRDNPDACWNWAGALSPDGYGKFSISRTDWRAHRYSFYLHNGYVPELNDNRHVGHTCHNRACVNPGHLKDMSARENIETRITVNAASGARNVYYDPKREKYSVNVESQGKSYHGGRYDTLQEAKLAAEALRISLFSPGYEDPGQMASIRSTRRPDQ